MNRRTFMKVSSLATLSFLTGVQAYANKDIEPQEPEKKKIYLTIDDGPIPNLEADILETLGDKKAVFYMIGSSINTKSGFDIACKTLESGHIIANHSYHHSCFPKISLDRARSEIEKTDAIIEKIHETAGIPRANKLFRFPYGAVKKSVVPFLKDLGYKIQFWDTDTNDWRYYSKTKPLSGNAIMENCRKAQDSDIVLCHERTFTANNIIPFYANSPEYELVLPT